LKTSGIPSLAEAVKDNGPQRMFTAAARAGYHTFGAMRCEEGGGYICNIVLAAGISPCWQVLWGT
jgi:hypothetical protein